MNRLTGYANSLSYRQMLFKPYGEGWNNVKIAFNLFDLSTSSLTKRQRVGHFLSGAVLCAPGVNTIVLIALRIFFPKSPEHYEKPPAWKRINHIVVLMLENRSFDSMLGKLYPKSAAFNGLSGNEENSYVDNAGNKHTLKVWTSHDKGDIPKPDLGELFDDINYQLFEKKLPSHVDLPTMGGFAQNYHDYICQDSEAQQELRERRGISEGGIEILEPTANEVREVMHYYSPEQVPVLTHLARTFAVSDMYHASAPNQTWPNRFFAHTGTAGGYENNKPLHFPYMMKTIFTRFNDLQRENGWKIYYHDVPHAASLSDLWLHPDQFDGIEDFFMDAKKGSLPSYSFIEPRYYQGIEFPNDQHPPHDLRHGEVLIADIYNALRESPKWKETLLVITYDEHGGCYDHVPPPSAVPPEPPRQGQVFNFDRYGVRVPAVFVSPLISPGTILRPPADAKAPVFDHSSITASVRNCFDLKEPLTERDKVAPDFSTVLNMPEGQYNMGPENLIAPPAPKTTIEETVGLIMTEFQESLAEMAAKLPDFSSCQNRIDCQKNSQTKIDELKYSAMKEPLGKASKDLFTRRQDAMTHFAHFVHKLA